MFEGRTTSHHGCCGDGQSRAGEDLNEIFGVHGYCGLVGLVGPGAAGHSQNRTPAPLVTAEEKIDRSRAPLGEPHRHGAAG